MRVWAGLCVLQVADAWHSGLCSAASDLWGGSGAAVGSVIPVWGCCRQVGGRGVRCWPGCALQELSEAFPQGTRAACLPSSQGSKIKFPS